MGELDRHARDLLSLLDSLERAGDATRIAPDRSWPEASSLVLADEVAVELGSPAIGSLGATLWTAEGLSRESALLRHGPDLDSPGPRSRRFGQVVVVTGAFERNPALDLQEALCDVELEGVTLRARPSSSAVWYRVSRHAMSSGFSLRHLGGALLRSLESLAGVEAALVLFLVEGAKPWPTKLVSIAQEASLVSRSLVKRSAPHEHECETCEFSRVCEEALRR